MKMEVLGKRVLVNPTAETKTGLIIIPDAALEKPSMGMVVKVGGEVTKVKAGDTVLYSKYTPMHIQLDGKQFFVLEEHEIVGRWPVGRFEDQK